MSIVSCCTYCNRWVERLIHCRSGSFCSRECMNLCTGERKWVERMKRRGALR